MAEQRDSERNVRGLASPPASVTYTEDVMDKKRAPRWLFDLTNIAPRKAWSCTYCHVIGSHRRGCHYVTERHHRPAKSARHGVLGRRVRAGGAGAAK